MWRLFVFSVLLVILPATASAEEFIIETAQIEQLRMQQDIEVIDEIEGRNTYLVRVEHEAVLQSPFIEVAARNEAVYVEPPRTFLQQADSDWGYAFLQLDEQIFGDNVVKVAVIDTGVDYENVALQPYLERGTSIFSYETAQDFNGHGTQVASIIASGSPETLRIVPIKALNANGVGSLYAMIEALYAAIDKQVNIINISVGIPTSSALLEQAIKDVQQQQIAIIAAVGNYGGEGVLFPARLDGVIGVGSINEKGTLSTFSQRGYEVDFVAPGERIRTYSLHNKQTFSTGTSFATPFVTKLAAGVLSNATAQQLPALLASAASQPMKQKDSGYGVIRMRRLNYELLSPLWTHVETVVYETRSIAQANKEWTVTFSAPLNEVVNKDAVFLRKDNELLPVTARQQHAQLIVTPTEPYESGASYALVITTNMTAATGEVLAKSVVQPFVFNAPTDIQ